MILGRRNVILSGAAVVVGYRSPRNRATQADLVLPGGSSRWAVLDRQARFLLSYYNAWVFQARTSRGAAQAFLVSSSPNDEVLSTDDMATVTSAIQRAIADLRGVSSCQTTQVNPDLTRPWNSDGGPSLIFGDAWTVYGYNCTIQGGGTSQHGSHIRPPTPPPPCKQPSPLCPKWPPAPKRPAPPSPQPQFSRCSSRPSSRDKRITEASYGLEQDPKML